jgi:hypothetical protein
LLKHELETKVVDINKLEKELTDWVQFELIKIEDKLQQIIFSLLIEHTITFEVYPAVVKGILFAERFAEAEKMVYKKAEAL